MESHLYTDPRFLFIDMNSFFASVEQQENPKFQNKPIIVVPVDSDGSCAISASYEAKAYGIKTGTSIGEAKAKCPDLIIKLAEHRKYVNYNRAIVEVLHHHFVTIKELSVDEMACLLPPSKKSPEKARQLGQQVKDHIKKQVGSAMGCSIGIAPNIFLAKVASDFKKPDGLTLFIDDYQKFLFTLKLTDLPGIAHRNEIRLKSHGIYTVEDLWNAKLSDLRKVWGGTVGERWHYMLRGSLEIDYGVNTDQDRKSVGHSHVLPPKFRTIDGARLIMLRLAQKALRRLRSYDQLSKIVCCFISFRHVNDWSQKYYWDFKHAHSTHANDDLCWMPIIDKYCSSIPDIPNFRPTKVAITFMGLQSIKSQQLSLLEDRSNYSRLFKMIDSLKDKGLNEVHIADVLDLAEEAPFRISFGQRAGTM